MLNFIILLQSIVLDAVAQGDTSMALAKMGAGIAASIAVIGASYGIGRIGSTAMEAIARQPEAAGDIRSGMIVSAALIEGVSFFALAVCFLILFV